MKELKKQWWVDFPHGPELEFLKKLGYTRESYLKELGAIEEARAVVRACEQQGVSSMVDLTNVKPVRVDRGAIKTPEDSLQLRMDILVGWMERFGDEFPEQERQQVWDLNVDRIVPRMSEDNQVTGVMFILAGGGDEVRYHRWHGVTLHARDGQYRRDRMLSSHDCGTGWVETQARKVLDVWADNLKDWKFSTQHKEDDNEATDKDAG